WAVHTCSSRKPLPTPPPFEYPIRKPSPVASPPDVVSGAAWVVSGVSASVAGGASVVGVSAAVVVLPPPPPQAATSSASTKVSAILADHVRFRVMSSPPFGRPAGR